MNDLDTYGADTYGAWAYLPDTPLQTHKSGPLSGLSFNVKDLFEVPGWPLHASTGARLPALPASPLVTRLLDMGATLTGKTHLHEIALGISGANPLVTSRNPLDPARMPGGSSSGAAITVQAGEVDFALGTDTGGSIRIPAAWCGVYGFKPTKGHPAWPTRGVLPLSGTCDHAGPLARDLGLISKLHELLCNAANVQEDTPQAEGWRGLRVAVWQPDEWLTERAQAAMHEAKARLEALGAVLEMVDVPALIGQDYLDTYSAIVQHEAAQTHAKALQDSPTGFSPATETLLRRGAERGEAEVKAAYERRLQAQSMLGTLLRGYYGNGGHDLLLAPTVADVAPLLGSAEMNIHGQEVPLRDAVLRLTVPFSLTGLPTLALPVAAEGLSVGVQLVTRPMQDRWLLHLGEQVGPLSVNG